MWRHELRIEEPEASLGEPRGEMHKGDFRRIGLAIEHALAEKCSAEMDAIKSARKNAAGPALDRMNLARFEELAVEGFDPPVDPGFLAPFGGGGAALDDGIKVRIDAHLETLGAHGLGQTLRDDEAIKRENAALLRVDPEEIAVFCALGHREKADGIGAQQNVGCDLELLVWAAHSSNVRIEPNPVKPEVSARA